jgi:hypothetical protein
VWRLWLHLQWRFKGQQWRHESIDTVLFTDTTCYSFSNSYGGMSRSLRSFASSIIHNRGLIASTYSTVARSCSRTATLGKK